MYTCAYTCVHIPVCIYIYLYIYRALHDSHDGRCSNQPLTCRAWSSQTKPDLRRKGWNAFALHRIESLQLHEPRYLQPYCLRDESLLGLGQRHECRGGQGGGQLLEGACFAVPIFDPIPAAVLWGISLRHCTFQCSSSATEAIKSGPSAVSTRARKRQVG